jgi:hypothetical protein
MTTTSSVGPVSVVFATTPAAGDSALLARPMCPAAENAMAMRTASRREILMTNDLAILS